MSVMQRMRRHPGRVIALGIFLCLLIIVGILLYRSKYCLKNTMYTLQSAEISAPIRIVQLTDLHNSAFGTGNQTLVDLVAKQQPDLIFITGDLLNANTQRTDIATNLISDLCEIAPVSKSWKR